MLPEHLGGHGGPGFYACSSVSEAEWEPQPAWPRDKLNIRLKNRLKPLLFSIGIFNGDSIRHNGHYFSNTYININ